METTTNSNIIDDDEGHTVCAILEPLLGRSPTTLVRHEAYKPSRVWSADGLTLKVNPLADVQAEAWALGAAAAAGVPVPTVMAVGADHRLPGGRYFVMTRLAGDELPRDPSLVAETGRYLRKLHAVPVAGFGRLDAPAESWFDFLLRRTSEHLRLYAEPRITDLLDQWRSRLDDVPCVLLHGDIQPSHVRVRDGRIVGFIDFEQACGGDPAWEFAQAFSGVGTRDDFDVAGRLLPHLLAGYGEIDLSRLPVYRALVALAEVAFNVEHHWTEWVAEDAASLNERVLAAQGAT